MIVLWASSPAWIDWVGGLEVRVTYAPPHGVQSCDYVRRLRGTNHTSWLANLKDAT